MQFSLTVVASLGQTWLYVYEYTVAVVDLVGDFKHSQNTKNNN